MSKEKKLIKEVNQALKIQLSYEKMKTLLIEFHT